MVDVTDAEQHMNQGIVQQRVKSNGHAITGSSVTDSDMLSEGIHGYTQITQSAFSQKLKKFTNKTLIPLLLVITIPNLVIVMWYTVMRCNGSYLQMVSVFSNRSITSGLAEMWSQVRYPSAPIIVTLIAYGFYALFMMKFLPGDTVYGPLTPKGNIPVYKDNGFIYFCVTIGLFWMLTILLHQFGITPSIIYDRFDEVLFSLSVFSLIFCAFLYLKGRFFPSSSDSGSSGNIIFDYYWGMELYPRVFGFDVKVFTNCRFGMMAWALLVCVHVVKSYELYGFVDSMFVSAFLQLVYITKFFWWESGYLHTIDIILDRAGFYICWGCLVYIPAMYASVSFYLVSHPVTLGPVVSMSILFLGALSIYINFAADYQKQIVRHTNGSCMIWGCKPDIIRAKYQLENGDIKESILLASGWWGLSRHFHYVPEIMLAFFWSVPALFNHLFPYSYLIFLSILLFHRSYRDDKKCSKKYGVFWLEYCNKVPHKIIPFLF